MSGIDLIESAVLRDTGRPIELLAQHGAGDLAVAARHMDAVPAVAIVTGFAVPCASGPEPETDGPIGSAALAYFLEASGRRWTVVTDPPNGEVCVAALTAYGLTSEVRVVGHDDVVSASARLQQDGFTTVVFVERLGPNSEGRYLSMGGVDMTPATTPLDQLLTSAAHSIGIGDGGNEVGMGKIPAEEVARVIAGGERIHCVSRTDELILAGVSNWGAWALVGAAAVVNSGNADAAAGALSVDRWHASLKLAVEAGAVDGVKLARSLSVDGFESEMHDAVLTTIRVLANLE